MKKLLMLVCMLLLCTGCTITYDLKIYRDMQYEEILTFEGTYEDYSIDITNPKELEGAEEYIKEYNKSAFEDVDTYEIIENTASNNKYIFKIKSKKQDINNLKNSSIIKKFYNKQEISKRNENYIFSLDREEYTDEEGYTPYEFNELIINVQSKKRIINYNSDSNRNNIHTWHIVGETMKQIDFEITDSNIVEPVQTYSILILIALGVIGFFIKKSQKINEIK